MATHVVSASRATATMLLERTPHLGPHDVSVVTNAFETVDTDADTLRLTGAGDGAGTDRPLLITYTGSLSYGRDELLHRVIAELANLNRTHEPKVRLVVASEQGERVRRFAAEHGVSEWVTTERWSSREDSIALQRQSDVLLLLQPFNRPSFATNIPAKLFEYMGRRRPILAVVPDPGPAAEIVRDHGLGVVVDALDETGMLDRLEALVASVTRTPVLPSPPAQYSAHRTTADYARVLARVVSRGTPTAET